ncbi:MAG: hypothetical protein A3J46_03865 [Candidatus Yanofskybacteria bacterium RIFCSPHIGHO2_02_FULL_41_11]|uniref:TIGR03987 family protein n=1 Tax=Candidatus Yanofskybacteria bacterium RIFCSPHIGHO2_02_FULL_41_11 TaxID=1802675 RepID=A0A1F8F8H0_9BACT|nr:MAG: hypothetical protein A3J46_03865 [Candidatus Yanofskybacteria bacterium RIFCSPHIGHO2_02_FULL_41_11]
MQPVEFLFIIALFFYSLVIWWHKARKILTPFMVWLFGIGLIADTAGTIFVCVLATNEWKFNPHTIFGLTAFLIMAAHFLWAILAIKSRGNFEVYFDRYSVKAWFFWLIAFVSGIPR